MKHHTIRHHTTKEILFSGLYHSFKECIEHAILCGTNLNYAEIRHKNLSNALLDDAKLENAFIYNSNLNGANMSESKLKKATITSCSLYNTCLAYTDLRDSRFQNAEFGGTEMAGANISGASFTSGSFLLTNFSKVQINTQFTYTDHQKRSHVFTNTPIVLNGIGTHPIPLNGKAINYPTITQAA